MFLLVRLLAPAAMLTAIAVGVIYVRLLNGPISLKALAQPIARAIEADLGGFGVTVGDAAVLLGEGNSLEFRLRDVKLADSEGAPVALAPLAAVTLSTNAIWAGRIAPERVVLIEPRLLLLYSREQGLALSFARPAEAVGPAAEGAGGAAPDLPANRQDRLESVPGAITQTLRASIPDTGTAGGTVLSASSQASTAIDMGRMIAGLAARTHDGGTTSAFLKQFGLRNATLIFDNAGQQAIWHVAEGQFGFNRRRQGNVIAGNMVLASPAGRWHLSFTASERQAAGSIGLDAKFTNFVPRTIADTLPAFAPLAALDLPIDGVAQLILSPRGELMAATAQLDGRRGALVGSWHGGGRLDIEGGRLSLGYRRETNLIEVGLSRLSTGQSFVSMAGSIGVPQHGGESWAFDLRGIEGVIADASVGLAATPIEALSLRGSVDAAARAIRLDDARFRIAGGEATVRGTLAGRGSAERLAIDGVFSPMPAHTLMRMWPPLVAPAARRWSGTHVEAGRLTSGKFVIADAQGPRTQADAGPRVSVTLVGENVRLRPRAGFAPVLAPRALLRFEGNQLEVAAPEASILTSANRRLTLKGVRMLAKDVASRTAAGELTLRVLGPVPAVLDLIPKRTRDGRPVKLPGTAIDGKIDADLTISVPLGEDLTSDDVRLSGKGRVTEGKARDVIGSHDVQGAGIAFELSEHALEAKGEMLVSGVAATISFGRIFAAADRDQPPTVLRAKLDAADRTQLKLGINDLVQGETPIEIEVKPGTDGDSVTEVRADLTNAEVVIESLAWKKPAGRTARLLFEVKDAGGGRTELANVRLMGDDLALSGTMSLDKANRLVAFQFPEVTLNVVSRLKAEGRLKAGDVWDVTVRGQTFDGRDFFRSLFAVGAIRDKPLPPGTKRSGLDLDARIDNVLGYHELSLKAVTMRMTKRDGRLMGLTASGSVSSGNESRRQVRQGAGRDTAQLLEVEMRSGGGPRRLTATSNDAGDVFRLVGFYPSMQGGRMRLDVNLDGRGAAEKTGILLVQRFQILGDPVPYEAPMSEDGPAPARGKRVMQRPVLPFDSMRAPFSVGHGQFVIEDADLRGPVLGVLLKGKADFRSQQLDLGGTYVPLQGLNSAIGNFPLLGQLLAGPRGEGVIGMTFAVKGPMDRPQMLINPVSFGLPGFLRELTQMTNPSPRVTPRGNAPAAQPGGRAPSVRSSGTAGKGRRQPATSQPRVDADGGWSSKTVPAPKP